MKKDGELPCKRPNMKWLHVEPTAYVLFPPPTLIKTPLVFVTICIVINS